MKRDFNIVTSLVGAGLEREYLLLRDLLISQGHYCVGIHYTNLANATMVRADCNIFLEVCAPPVLNLSRENWLFPNSEWYDPKIDQYLPRITKVLCKTKHCYELWCAKVGPAKCVYTSFEARDIYKPEIPREVKFLHLAGKSEHKNTEAVCRAYRMTHMPHEMPLPPLTLIARAPGFLEMCRGEFYDGNVTWHEKVTDEEVIQLMNSHLFHLMPSMYEGFGHSLHEALGCGGIVLTTDAPPMNQFDGIWREGLIKVAYPTPRALAQLSVVDCTEVEPKIRKTLNTYWTEPDRIKQHSLDARAAFLADRDFFRKTFMDLVSNLGR